MEYILYGTVLSLDELDILSKEEVVSLYEEYGNNFVDMVQGHFAFQAYKDKENSLIFTDRFGFFPCFLGPGNKLCKDIDFKTVNEDFLKVVDKYDDLAFNSNIKKELINAIRDFRCGSKNFKHFYSIKEIHKLLDTLYFDTLDINYHCLICNSIYNIENGMVTRHTYKNTNIYYKGTSEERLLYVVDKLCKSNKVLCQLSSGHDTRLIASCLYKLGKDFDYLSFGGEKEFVDTLINEVINKKGIEINSDVIMSMADDLISENLIYTNGFGDPFQRIQLYYFVKYIYPEYYCIFNGGGTNQYFSYFKDQFQNNFYNCVYSTGLGHFMKYQLERTFTINPILDMKFLYSIRNFINKNEVIKDITKRICPELASLPYPEIPECYKTNHFTTKTYDFNTKRKYINMLIEYLHLTNV